MIWFLQLLNFLNNGQLHAELRTSLKEQKLEILVYFLKSGFPFWFAKIGYKCFRCAWSLTVGTNTPEMINDQVQNYFKLSATFFVQIIPPPP